MKTKPDKAGGVPPADPVAGAPPRGFVGSSVSTSIWAWPDGHAFGVSLLGSGVPKRCSCPH
eukprot:6563451-Lingulodinium_polyedra.AAC.1